MPPKYDREFWKSETFPIDSAKFLLNTFLLISDRQSILKGNEEPCMSLRWIYYPRRDKVQLCLAISGSFHIEKISYNRVKVDKWHERMWVYLPPQILPKIIKFLERNPLKVASWM